MTATSAPKAGPLDLTFTATLRQEPGKGGWTYVVMDGSADVFATRGLVKVSGTIDDQPFTTAVFRHQINPVLDGIARRANRKPLAIEPHFSGNRPVQADHRLGDFRASGTNEPGKAENFALRRIERHCLVGVHWRPDIAHPQKGGRFLRLRVHV